MGRIFVCALFFCLLPATAGATSEHIPALPELSAEHTSFAYRVRHAARPLPGFAFDALWFGGDREAPARVAVAEPIVEVPAMTVRHVPSRTALCSHAAAVAAEHNLPAPFFANLIQQESGFRSHAVSPAGAQGIAQFMPRTARAYGLHNPFDPLHSMAVSAKFLRDLLSQFGNLGLAAAAYNAGPKRVQDWMKRRGKLPEETRDYVRKITGQSAERWARVKGPTEDKALPAHARCPGMPTIEVRVPEAAPVKIAKGKGAVKGKATKIAAKDHKDKKGHTLASVTSAKKAIVKDGKIRILAEEKSSEKAKIKSAAKLAAKAAVGSAKPGTKLAAKPGSRKQAKGRSGKGVKIAEAR